MAQLRALQGPWEIAGLSLPRRVLRNTRLMVPIAIALICGSFAAAATISLRLDRSHALSQAAHFEAARARDLAQVAAAALNRMAASGAQFAANPEALVDDAAIRNIAIFRQGALVAALHPQVRLPPPPDFPGGRTVSLSGQDGELAVQDDGRTIAVLFDPATLAPASLLSRAALYSSAAAIVSGAGWRSGGERLEQAVPGWPLKAGTEIDSDDALMSWRGLLPLYLFVILGPAVAGGWLAALFVGSFERHEKAAHAIRSLKTLRPVEAKLMVRLAQAERAAAEAARSKSEFIAHMSHELRTPLNAMIGFSEIIGRGLFGPPGHPKYAEYAGDIAEAGRGLHDRIGDILEFANIEAGRFPLQVQSVDLAALATQCVEEHKGRAFNRQVMLDIGFALPVRVEADPLAVRRILSNLIVNALAYTAQGGAVLVDVRAEEGAGVALVRDSGPGFTAAERRRAGAAFQRFERTGRPNGAGLGLAIAMELSRRMGGAMRLCSRPGDGSAMELRLPRADASN
jgi:signal transduction histidine kinase